MPAYNYMQVVANLCADLFWKRRVHAARSWRRCRSRRFHRGKQSVQIRRRCKVQVGSRESPCQTSVLKLLEHLLPRRGEASRLLQLKACRQKSAARRPSTAWCGNAKSHWHQLAQLARHASAWKTAPFCFHSQINMEVQKWREKCLLQTLECDLHTQTKY